MRVYAFACGHHFQQGVDQTNQVAILARGLGPRSRLRIWSSETGPAVPSRVRLPIIHAQAESGAYSRAPLLPLNPAFLSKTGPIYTVNRHHRCGHFHIDLDRTIAYRWCSLQPRHHWSSIKVARVTGAAYSGNSIDQSMLAFPHPLFTQWACALSRREVYTTSSHMHLVYSRGPDIAVS